jgi:hypothetical protein
LALYLFPLLLLVSLAGCIIGTYSAPPTEEAVLLEFYKNVKPWGFWKPIKNKLIAQNITVKDTSNFKSDMFNVFVGTVAQTALVIMPMYLVFNKTTPLLISSLVLIICLILLKKYWWNTLTER